MTEYDTLLQSFIQQSKQILDDELTGIYLHGSAAMDCFNPEKSDIDLLIVVKHTLPDDLKKKYMNMVVGMNERSTAKGIEMSILRESVCRPFIYPTPFELHFSSAHLEWYRTAPDDYISKMKGTDRDIAAHVTILNNRGRTLFGKPIKEVFGEVSSADYFDSIYYDIENAATDIADEPMYVILNLSRVLAYKNDGLILSKKEGGEWGLSHLPEVFKPLLKSALDEYTINAASVYGSELSAQFAEYMLGQIGKN